MIGRKKEHSVWHKTMKRGEKDVEVANGAKEKRKGESTSNWHSNHVQRSGLEVVVCLVGGRQRNKKSERKIEAVKGEWTSHFSVERKKEDERRNYCGRMRGTPSIVVMVIKQ